MKIKLKNISFLNEGKYDSEINRIGKDLLKIYKSMFERTIKASSLNLKKNINSLDSDIKSYIPYIFKDNEDIIINFNEKQIQTTLLITYHYNQEDDYSDLSAGITKDGNKMLIKLYFPFHIMLFECLKYIGHPQGPKDFDHISKLMQDLSHKLTTTLTHELTHAVQILQNKNVYTTKSDHFYPTKKSFFGYNKKLSNLKKYFTSESEIEAYTHQFYKLAKRKKIPFSTLLKQKTLEYTDSYQQNFFKFEKDKKKRENISLEIKDIFSRFFFACINLADQKYPKAQMDQKDIQEIKDKLL